LKEQKGSRHSRANAFFELSRVEDETPGTDGEPAAQPPDAGASSLESGPSSFDLVRPSDEETTDGLEPPAGRSFGALLTDEAPTGSAARTDAYEEDDEGEVLRRAGRKADVILDPPGPVTESLTTTEIQPQVGAPGLGGFDGDETAEAGAIEEEEGATGAGAPGSGTLADTRHPLAPGKRKSGAASGPPGDQDTPVLGAGTVPRADRERRERIRRLERQRSQEPENVDVMVRLAGLLQEDGREEEARSLLEAARELAPEDRFIVAKLNELGADLPTPGAPAEGAGATSGGRALQRIWRGALPAAMIAAVGGFAFGHSAPGGAAIIVVACLWVLAAQGAAASGQSLRFDIAAASLGRGLGAALATFLLPALLCTLTWIAWPQVQEVAATGDAASTAVDRYAQLLMERDGLNAAEARTRAMSALDLTSLGAAASTRIPLQSQLVAALSILALAYGLLYYPLALGSSIVFDNARAPFQHVDGWQLAAGRWPQYARTAATVSAANLVGLAACLLAPRLSSHLPLPDALGVPVAVGLAAVVAALSFVAAAFMAGEFVRSAEA
jgi:hypothetical protein